MDFWWLLLQIFGCLSSVLLVRPEARHWELGVLGSFSWVVHVCLWGSALGRSDLISDSATEARHAYTQEHRARGELTAGCQIIQRDSLTSVLSA